jgi:hypothetical protein
MTSVERHYFVNTLINNNRIKGYFNCGFVRDKIVKSASLVPLHYHTGLKKKCIILGKEKGYPYNDLYNFFGGKREQYTNSQITDTLFTLFDETYEEFGMILEPDNFLKCLLGIKSARAGRNGVSVLFFVHLTGMSRKLWNSVYHMRQNNGYMSKYLEMSEISHVPIDTLHLQRVSKFVFNNIGFILEMVSYISPLNAVHVSNFRFDGQLTIKKSNSLKRLENVKWIKKHSESIEKSLEPKNDPTDYGFIILMVCVILMCIIV